MTPTLTRRRPVPLRRAGGNLLVAAGVGAVALIGLVLAPAQQLPSFVSRITVTNPTPYHVEVDVRGAPDRGWLSLGGFAPDSTRSSYEVVDQGRQWVVRFSAGGREGGEMIVTRAQLEASKWRLQIPEIVAERLEEAGLTVD